MKFILLLLILGQFSSVPGLIFDCNIQEVGWKDLPGAYTCETEIVYSGDPNLLEEVRGGDAFGNNYNDIEAWSVSNNVLHRIPTNLKDFFPNLKLIELRSTDLTSLTADDLNFPNLEVLMFSGHHNLTSIDGDLFKHTPKLHYIFCFDNGIRHVGNDLLVNLPKLSRVYFSTRCIDSYASTKERIADMILQLPVKCPPLPATTISPVATNLEWFAEPKTYRDRRVVAL